MGGLSFSRYADGKCQKVNRRCGEVAAMFYPPQAGLREHATRFSAFAPKRSR
jgi:hypothetical protein